MQLRVGARESLVDRNITSVTTFRTCTAVGARESLVDRNFRYIADGCRPAPSGLARASWIEIFMISPRRAMFLVGARESLVDRNSSSATHTSGDIEGRGSREPRGSK